MEIKFGIGKVIGTGLQIWAGNLLVFVVITALMYSPVILCAAAIALEPPSAVQVHHLLTFLSITTFGAPVIQTLISATVTYAAIARLHGERPRIRECIRTGFRRFLPALGAVVLAYLAAALAYFGGAMPLVCVAEAVAPVNQGAATTTSVGAGICGALAAAYVYSWHYIATQAVVIDRARPVAALLRSRNLTCDHQFVLWLFLVLLVAIDVGTMIVVFRTMLGLGLPLYFACELTRRVIFGSLSSVMASVAYYYLRAEKEGTSAAELAAIFD